MTVLASQSMEVKSPCGGRNEEEDSLSDAGTYTIEADTQDKELEDARNKISQASVIVDLVLFQSSVSFHLVLFHSD